MINLLRLHPLVIKFCFMLFNNYLFFCSKFKHFYICFPIIIKLGSEQILQHRRDSDLTITDANYYQRRFLCKSKNLISSLTLANIRNKSINRMTMMYSWSLSKLIISESISNICQILSNPFGHGYIYPWLYFSICNIQMTAFLSSCFWQIDCLYRII